MKLDVLGAMPDIKELRFHPFGKGALTSNGVQYSTAVTGVDNSAYSAVDTATIYLPPKIEVTEVEFGLTGAIKVDGTGSTDDINWKWQASDDGSNWEDLMAAQTLSNTNTYTDVTRGGTFAPTGYFLATGNSFQVRMVIASSGATDTVAGKTKNSSYVVVRCRMYS